MMTLCETSAGVADRLGGGLQSRYKWVQLPSPAPKKLGVYLILIMCMRAREGEIKCPCFLACELVSNILSRTCLLAFISVQSMPKNYNLVCTSSPSSRFVKDISSSLLSLA